MPPPEEAQRYACTRSIERRRNETECKLRLPYGRVYTHFSFSLAPGSKNLTATSRLPRVVVVPYSGIPSASATYTFMNIIRLNRACTRVRARACARGETAAHEGARPREINSP